MADYCATCRRDAQQLALEKVNALPYDRCKMCKRRRYLRRDDTYVELMNGYSPVTVLANHCNRREWNLVRRRLAIYPQEAVCPRPRQNHSAQRQVPSALYYACLHGAPVDVLKLLAQTAPQEIATCTRFTSRASPLQTLLSLGTCEHRLEKTMVLIEAEFKYYYTSCIPPTFLGSYEYPVHRLLVALDNASKVLHSGIQSALEARRHGDHARAGNLLRDPSKRYTDFPAQWSVLSFLYRALYHSATFVVDGALENDWINKSAVRSKPLLHALVGCRNQLGCPENVVSFAIAIEPKELRLADENGNLPLHVAARSIKPNTPKRHEVDAIPAKGNFRYTALVERAPRSAHYKGNLVSILLQEYPEAASVRNQQGTLPLHLSLRSGKVLKGGVEELLRYNPAAIGEVDPATRLYPFQLAAVYKDSREISSRQLERLSTIYHLLRRNPTVAFPS